MTSTVSQENHQKQEAAPQQQQHQDGNNQGLPVFLYIPNLLGYARILLAFVGTGFSPDRPVTAVIVWVTSAFLDLFDGYLARRFNQTSTFGIYLDIAADNILRSCICMSAAVASVNNNNHNDDNDNQSIMTSTTTTLLIVCFIVCLEWIAMVTSQLHAQIKQMHWKKENDSNQNEQPPWWIRQIFRNNFKGPVGILTIYGLFGYPIILYSQNFSILRQVPFYYLWKWAAYLGRVSSITCEFYLISCFLTDILPQSSKQTNNKQQEQQQISSSSKQD